MESDEVPYILACSLLRRRLRPGNTVNVVSPKMRCHRRSRDSIRDRGPAGQSVLWDEDPLEKGDTGIAFEKLELQMSQTLPLCEDRRALCHGRHRASNLALSKSFRIIC